MSITTLKSKDIKDFVDIKVHDNDIRFRIVYKNGMVFPDKTMTLAFFQIDDIAKRRLLKKVKKPSLFDKIISLITRRKHG